jgi:hypothetical protein
LDFDILNVFNLQEERNFYLVFQLQCAEMMMEDCLLCSGLGRCYILTFGV